MNSFLYVMVDDIPILMDGDSVDEVLALTEDDYKSNSASGHLSWRNQMLPIVNARKLLMLGPTISAKNCSGVVYRVSPHQSPIFLVVDEVVKIMKLKQEDFLPLPQVPDKVRLYFDRVYLDCDKNRQVYRLRSPLLVGVLEDVAGVAAI